MALKQGLLFVLFSSAPTFIQTFLYARQSSESLAVFIVGIFCDVQKDVLDGAGLPFLYLHLRVIHLSISGR